MISKTIRTVFLTLVVSLSGIAATSATSQAGNLAIDFTIGGPGFYFSSGRTPHRGGRWNGYRDHRYDDRYGYRQRVCSPRKALRKARRMGVRDARIVRVNNRVVVVKGYRYGGRAKVRFGRSGNCPVYAFRTR